MGKVKVVSWNVEYLDKLTPDDLADKQQKRRDAVIREIHELSPDILCLLEGPNGSPLRGLYPFSLSADAL